MLRSAGLYASRLRDQAATANSASSSSSESVSSPRCELQATLVRAQDFDLELGRDAAERSVDPCVAARTKAPALQPVDLEVDRGPDADQLGIGERPEHLGASAGTKRLALHTSRSDAFCSEAWRRLKESDGMSASLLQRCGRGYRASQCVVVRFATPRQPPRAASHSTSRTSNPPPAISSPAPPSRPRIRAT